MAVAAADLLSPTGEIEGPALWPGEDSSAVNARLAGYIEDGEAQAADIEAGAAHDAAVKAWAYHRAYLAVFIVLSRKASSVTVNDQASTSMVVAQIQNFKDLSDAKRAEFDGLVAEVAGTETAVTQPTVAAKTVIAW